MKFAVIALAVTLLHPVAASAKVGPTTLQLMNAQANRFDMGMAQLNTLLIRRWPLIQDSLRPSSDFNLLINDLWASFNVDTGRVMITAYLSGDVTPFLACHQFFSSLRGSLGIDLSTGKPTDGSEMSGAAAAFSRPGYTRKDEAGIDIARMDQVIWIQVFTGPKTFKSSTEEEQLGEVLRCDGRLLGTDFTHE